VGILLKGGLAIGVVVSVLGSRKRSGEKITQNGIEPQFGNGQKTIPKKIGPKEKDGKKITLKRLRPLG
jgi:hypothetical protein